MTGFSRGVRQVIKDREEQRCARCGAPGVQIHHRRPRSMGGTLRPETNGAANGLYFCLKCHNWTESYRQSAEAFGYLVSQEMEPTEVPVFYPHGANYQGWVLFDNEGGVNPTDQRPPTWMNGQDYD